MWVCVGQEVPGTGMEQIYFGRTAGDLDSLDYRWPKVVVLKDCQLCCFLSPVMRSWFELAARGPNDGCRVSNPVKSAIVGNVREIIECTEQAVQAWKSVPWAERLPQQIMGANGTRMAS